MKNKVSVCIWNINGLKNEKIDRFSSKDSVTEEIFTNNDIICLTETWRDKTDRDLTELDDNFIGFHQLGAANGADHQVALLSLYEKHWKSILAF